MPAILSTICFDTYLTLIMFKLSGIIKSGENIRLYLFIFLALESIALFLINPLPPESKLKHHGYTTSSLLYLGLIVYYLPFLSLGTSEILQTIFFPACMLIAQTNYRRISDKETLEKILNIQFYFTLIFALCFFITQIRYQGEYRRAINTIYYLVFNLPFLLQNKSKVKRIVGLVAILFCTIWSMKRTPIIILGIIYLLVPNKTRYSSKTATIIVRLVKIITCALILNLAFFKLYDINFISRFQSIAEDGGSGRVDLISTTISLLKNNTLGQWILGNGLQSTNKVFLLGAHNDFLEVLYRTGLIGFAIYISYYYKIFKYIFSFSSNGKNILLVTMIIFITMSLTSQLFFLPSYAALLAMSFNLAISYERLENTDEQIQETT